MTRIYTPPDLRQQVADLARRLGVLERRISTQAAAVDESYSIMFSFTGELTETTSPPVRPWRGGNLVVLAVTLGTAGSSDTDIDILLNGTAVATVTIPASAEVWNGGVAVFFEADVDVLALEITSAGTGAADMTAEARFVG